VKKKRKNFEIQLKEIEKKKKRNSIIFMKKLELRKLIREEIRVLKEATKTALTTENEIKQ